MSKVAFSAMLNEASGRMGNVVYARSRSGVATRTRPKYKQFPHPEAAAARGRMEHAAQVWRTFDGPEYFAWNAYAKTIRLTNSLTAQAYSPLAYNAFIGLATRFLLANPDGEIPRFPPAADYLGESITLEIMETPAMSEEKCAASGAPFGVYFRAEEAGKVIIQATGPNREDTVTEILVQPLAGLYRAPKPFYKSAAIHQFESGALDFVLPLPPGAYALQYRFIQKTTGLATMPLDLGRVEVS
ncbi:MAG TPA: hypothetical protein PLX06_03250 [Fimbriimonadaceae bacterium]|nr:hypothetical protein [Fimbriimonadaceae bacterium]